MKKRKIVHVIGHTNHGATTCAETIARDISGRGMTIVTVGSHSEFIEKSTGLLENKPYLLKTIPLEEYSPEEFKHTSKYHK